VLVVPVDRPPAAVAEGLRSYSAAGTQHVVLGLIGDDDWHRQCELLAEAASLT
jgi:hypothetical protein